MKQKHTIQAKSLPFILTLTVILCLYTLILAFMVYIALNITLNTGKGLRFNFAYIKFPTKYFTLENYVTVFEHFQVKKAGSLETTKLPEMLFNSIVHAVSCAFASVMVKALVAYVVAKYDEKFNKFIYTTVIISMIVPVVGALPSEIQVAEFFGLRGTRFGLALMRASYLGMHFLILYGTFRGLSDEYIEAAEIDGAGQWRILFSVVLPLVKTALLALFILNLIAFWNEYQGPLIYMPDFPTAAVGLYMFENGLGGDNLTAEMGLDPEIVKITGTMVIMLPILVMFLCFKNVFMGNLTVGGIKG